MASTSQASTARQRLLREIQETSFTMYDIQLYLDTHPDDSQALSRYSELNQVLHALMHDYSDKFGAITPNFITTENGFTWTSSPWPWQEG